jgi:tetratricopeptide (TPR) repeat protein
VTTESASGHTRAFHRETFGLAVLIAVGVTAFVLTRAFASANRQMRLDDAARWSELGEARKQAGAPADAIVALRRAVAIDRDNINYRLALAGALAASGQDEAALQLLISLRQFTPEDPDVNLRLARLEARRQDLTATIQYYQNAIYGLWPAARVDERRSVRRELIEFLLQHDQRSRALSELLILSANLPDDADSQKQIGSLFLKAGDSRRALEHFTRALRFAPDDTDTLRSAGEAAFTAGEYGLARRYLSAVKALSGPDADMREIAHLVMTADPLAPRLKLDERYRRLHMGLVRAAERLAACGASLEPQQEELQAFTDAATRRALADDPDLIDQGVDLIGTVERAADATCGGGTASDRAWRAIAARHGGPVS